MTLRIGSKELQPSVTKTADFSGAELDDLDHFTRGGVLLDVTAIGGTTPIFQFVLFASLDGTNFFEIGRTANITATGKHVIPFDQRSGAGSPTAPFDIATALAAGALRLGIPFRALRFDVDLQSGTTPTITYSATAYVVGSQV